jgi:hypothetical protein
MRMLAPWIGALDIKNDAGENVSERALQRQTDDDRQSTGGRQQTFHRQIENIGDDRESSREVDERGQQVLNQFRFARLSSQHDERTQETDREPGRAQPPDDFEYAHEHQQFKGNALTRAAGLNHQPACAA